MFAPAVVLLGNSNFFNTAAGGSDVYVMVKNSTLQQACVSLCPYVLFHGQHIKTSNEALPLLETRSESSYGTQMGSLQQLP